MSISIFGTFQYFKSYCPFHIRAYSPIYIIISCKINRITIFGKSCCRFVKRSIHSRRKQFFVRKCFFITISYIKVVKTLTRPFRYTPTSSLCAIRCCKYYLIITIKSYSIFRKARIDIHRVHFKTTRVPLYYLLIVLIFFKKYSSTILVICQFREFSHQRIRFFVAFHSF